MDDDTDLTEDELDAMMACGIPVRLVTPRGGPIVRVTA